MTTEAQLKSLDTYAFDNIVYRLKWWESLCLKVIKEQKAEDTLDGYTTIVYFKVWRGRIYVTDIVSHFTVAVIINHQEEIPNV